MKRIFIVFLLWYIVLLIFPEYDSIFINTAVIFTFLILIWLNADKQIDFRVNYLSIIFLSVFILPPLITYFYSVSKYSTLIIFYRNFNLILTFFIFNSFVRKKKYLFLFFKTVFIVICLFNLILVVTKLFFIPSIKTILFYKNPNILGDILNTGLFLGIGLSIVYKTSFIKKMLMIVFFVTGIFMTGSLGSIVTLTVSLVAFFFLIKSPDVNRRIFSIKNLMFLILCIALLAAGIKLRMIKTLKDPFTNNRLKIWHTAVESTRDHLFSGAGSGCFKKVSSKYNFPLNYIARYSKTPKMAHNKALQVLTEEGLFSLIFYLFFIILFYTYSFNTIVNLKDKAYRNMFVALLSVITGIFLHSMVDFPFQNLALIYLLVLAVSYNFTDTESFLVRIKLNKFVKIAAVITLLIVPAVNLTGEIMYNKGIEYFKINPEKAYKYFSLSSIFIPLKAENYQRLGGLSREKFYRETSNVKKIVLREKSIRNFIKGSSYDRYNDVFLLNNGKSFLDLFISENKYLNWAEFYFKQAASVNPYNPEIYYFLANLYLKRKNERLSDNYIDTILRIEPYYIKANVLKLKILVNNKKFNDASDLVKDIDYKLMKLDEEIKRKLKYKIKELSGIDYLIMLAEYDKKKYQNLKNILHSASDF